MMAQEIIDFAIEVHGGAEVSDDFPLASMFAQAVPLGLPMAR